VSNINIFTLRVNTINRSIYGGLSANICVCFKGFSRVPFNTGLGSTSLQQTPSRTPTGMVGQSASSSFGTPSHGQNTSSYLPGYLLGGHTPSHVVSVINQ
jgi:hypothetical protein